MLVGSPCVNPLPEVFMFPVSTLRRPLQDALVRVLTSLYGPATDNCITQGELLVGTAQ